MQKIEIKEKYLEWQIVHFHDWKELIFYSVQSIFLGYFGFFYLFDLRHSYLINSLLFCFCFTLFLLFIWWWRDDLKTRKCYALYHKGKYEQVIKILSRKKNKKYLDYKLMAFSCIKTNKINRALFYLSSLSSKTKHNYLDTDILYVLYQILLKKGSYARAEYYIKILLTKTNHIVVKQKLKNDLLKIYILTKQKKIFINQEIISKMNVDDKLLFLSYNLDSNNCLRINEIENILRQTSLIANKKAIQLIINYFVMNGRYDKAKIYLNSLNSSR